MKKILVFTATYNEKDNIKEYLEKLLSQNIQFDILIVDDNSPDGTNYIIQDYQKKYSQIKLHVREKKMGLDTAHKFAYEYAKKNSYDVLLTMDADLSHNPQDIKYFLKEIENFHFIIGSRYMKDGKNKMRGFRFFLSSFGNILIKFLTGIKLTEFTTSFRAFNLKKLNNFNLNKVNVKGYSFFMGTVCTINSLGYSILEIPIIFDDRHNGKSKIPKIEILRTLFYLIKFSINLKIKN